MSEPRSRADGAPKREQEKALDIDLQLDQLIAGAEFEASEAERIIAEGEVKTVKENKREREAKVERVTELEQYLAGLQADDASVGEHGFDWIMTFAEEETGIARPDRLNASVQTLLRAGRALRKLALVESKNDAFLEKMARLQELHAQLFDTVQDETVKALESMKKKYKGETSELDVRLAHLQESPLLRGVEAAPDTPEAREKALKQEITDLFLRQTLENRLKPVEKQLARAKERIVTLQEAYRVAEAEWKKIHTKDGSGGDPQLKLAQARLAFAKKHGLISIDYHTAPNVYEMESLVRDKVQEIKTFVEPLEQVVPRDRLAFEYNRAILDTVLAGEHDETALREAFVDLRTWLSTIEEVAQKSKHERLIRQPNNPLAQTVLGHAGAYWATLHRGKHGSGVEECNFMQQVLSDKALKSGSNAIYRVSIDAQDNQPKSSQSSNVGEAKYINMQIAYKQIDGDLFGEKTGQTQKAKTSPLTEPQKKLGWTESKLGALVEPDQNAKTVDREFAKMLEQLSGPFVGAERALDVQSPDGKLVAYTLTQAVDLARRTRRDAVQIAEQLRAIEQQGASNEQEKGALVNENARLIAELAKVREEARAQAQALTAQLEDARKESLAERQLGGEKLEKAKAQTRALETKIDTVFVVLADALVPKKGLFGGQKDLKAPVEEVVAMLRSTE